MSLRKVYAQLLAEADLKTGELVGVPESLMGALVKLGLVSTWERTGALQNMGTGDLIYLATARLTEKGIVVSKKLKSGIRCPRSDVG